MGKIIARDRSVVPACDVPDMAAFKALVKSTCDVSGIGGYKIGAALAIRYELADLVKNARRYTNKPLIYDHQKGATDIPDTPGELMKVVKGAGVDAIIGFPLSGPVSQEAFIRAASSAGLEVIMGGEMTHSGFRESEGGYISDAMLDKMYEVSARLGVNNFVVPGNKSDMVAHYLKLVGGIVKGEVSLWAPGFVAQGGRVTDAANAAGGSFHAIVGRGIYAADDMHAAAVELTSQLG